MSTTNSYMLDVKSVAAILGVKEKRVLGFIHDGHLPAENVTDGSEGRRKGRITLKSRPTWRIDPKALDRFRRMRNTIPEEVTRRRERNAASGEVNHIEIVRRYRKLENAHGQ